MREFIPNVIEPSFGIGRILYSLLEHSYWAREQDKARGVSDVSCSLTWTVLIPIRSCPSPPSLPRSSASSSLSAKTRLSARSSTISVRPLAGADPRVARPEPIVDLLAARKMRKLGIASRVDDSSASIGKKYARNDELGTPFGCTVDFACE